MIQPASGPTAQSAELATNQQNGSNNSCVTDSGPSEESAKASGPLDATSSDTQGTGSPKSADLPTTQGTTTAPKEQKEVHSNPDRAPPRRTHSASSTVSSTRVANESKETIDGPVVEKMLPLSAIDKTARTQSAPVGSTTATTIPFSDAASIGSVTSVLGSVGATTLAEQRLHSAQTAGPIPNVVTSATPAGTPVMGPMTAASMGDLPQYYLPPTPSQEPQHIRQGSYVSQTPTEMATSYATQAQPTILHQIPGMMAVPMSLEATQSAGGVVNSAGQVWSGQSQGNVLPQSMVQSQDQVVGMVGTIPIVKLQGGAVHFVKKTKGRFRFLQETPAMASTNPCAPVVSTTVPAGLSQPLPATQTQNVIPIHSSVPLHIAVPTQPQPSPTTAPAPQQQQQQPQAQPPGAAQPTPGKAVDGANAPQVKKKGRFVVTNVPVPEPVPVPEVIQTQQPLSGVQAPPQDGSNQPIQQQPQLQLLPQSTTIYQQPVLAHLSIPMDTQLVPPMAQPSSQPQIDPSAAFLYATSSHEQQTISQPLNGVDPMMSNPPQSSTQSVIDDSQYRQNNFETPVDRTPSVTQNGTPPPTPAGTVERESPGRRPQPAANVPNVPLPKLPQTTDKQAIAQGKKVAPKRPRRAPQSIAMNGLYGNFGLGKISYFLDQMKSEVAEADRMIKNLQTDTKLLRDKNKELEAKNRDLDRKLKEEIALREKCEARCLELQKALRESNGDIPAARARSVGQSVDDPKTKPLDKNVANGLNGRDALQPPAGGNSPSQNLKKVKEPLRTGPAGVVPPSLSTNKSLPRDVPAPQRAVPPGPDALPPKGPTPIPVNPTISRPQVSTGPEESKKDEPNSIPGQVSSTSNTAPKMVDTPSMSRVPADCSSLPDAGKAGSSDSVRQGMAWRSDTSQPQPAVHPPTPQHPHQATTRVNPQHAAAAPKAPSLRDFDPLGPSSSSNLGSDVVPVISFPTNMSLGAVPLGSPTPVFQDASGQTYSAAPAPFGEQYNQATFVSENPYMVPITFGLAPSAAEPNGGNFQLDMTNSFQMQPIMLQQPVMLQQVHSGVSQWPAAPPTVNGQQYYQQQMQPPQSHQQGTPADQFDPFR